MANSPTNSRPGSAGSGSGGGGGGAVQLPPIAGPQSPNGTGPLPRHLMYSRKSNFIRNDEDVDDLFLQSITAPGSARAAGGLRSKSFYGSEQHMANMNVKSNVVEHEEALFTQQDGQEERCDYMRKNLKLGNEKRTQSLHGFDDGFKWCVASGYDTARLMRDLKLRVSQAKIDELGYPVEVLQLSQLGEAFQTLLKEEPNEEEIEELESTISFVVMKMSLGRVNIAPAAVQLHELLKSDVLKYVMKQLAEKEEDLKRLYEEVEVADARRKELVATGQVVDASEAHLTVMEVLDKLIALIHERLHEVMLGTNDPESFKENFNTFQNKTMGAMDDFEADRKKFKEDINFDIGVIKADAARRKAIHEQHVRDAAEWKKQSHEKLLENCKKQDAVWARVMEILPELKPLCEERKEQVEIHMQKHEEEEERAYHYQEYVTSTQSQIASLEECMRHTLGTLEMTTIVNQYFEDGISLITNKEFDSSLDDMKLVEQRRYVEIVKRYTTVAADILSHKQKRLHGVRKLARSLKEECKMTAEALDPDADEYEKRVRELNVKADVVTREMVSIQEGMQRVISEFRETEETLREQGEDIAPPMMELEETLASRRQQFLERRRQMVEIEHHQLAEEEAAVKMKVAEAQVEEEAHREKVKELASKGRQKIQSWSPKAGDAAAKGAAAERSSTAWPEAADPTR